MVLAVGIFEIPLSSGLWDHFFEGSSLLVGVSSDLLPQLQVHPMRFSGGRFRLIGSAGLSISCIDGTFGLVFWTLDLGQCGWLSCKAANTVIFTQQAGDFRMICL